MLNYLKRGVYMQYLEWVLTMAKDFINWLGDYTVVLFALGVAFIALDFVWCLMRNPYRRINKQCRKQTTKIREALRLDKKVREDSIRLPKCYAHYYTSFLTQRVGTPSSYFVFSDRKFPKGLLLLTLTTLLLLFSIRGDIFSEVCLMAIAALMLRGIIWLKQKIDKKSAKRHFSRLMAMMDLAFGTSHSDAKQAVMQPNTSKTLFCEDSDVEDVVNRINFLKSNGINENTSKDIAQILSGEKLNRPRTVAQQRQINLALNGLLQVLSKKQASEIKQESV